MLVSIVMLVVLIWGFGKVIQGMQQMAGADAEEFEPEVHNHYHTDVQIHNSFNRSDYHAAAARYPEKEEEDASFITKRWR